ncbi:MAG: metalloregulator ArsR/SmtB family transcription factor [Bacillota bacterium]|nr:metalloregulator ArsR/SmtB family transcription factor [Bacillota bacterium]
MEHKTADVGGLPAPEAQGLAALFRVLGDETRCKIVSALIKRELCVYEITQAAGSSVSNVSHHLRLLRAARLVKYRKEQKRVFYSLDDNHVSALISQGLEHIKHS